MTYSCKSNYSIQNKMKMKNSKKLSKVLFAGAICVVVGLSSCANQGYGCYTQSDLDQSEIIKTGQLEKTQSEITVKNIIKKDS